jgi:peroxiredoxin
MRYFSLGILVASLTLCAPLLWAVDVSVGQPAPQFELTGSDGALHDLASYRGKTVVIAWFPKAFTGG